jgi:hypothetical protein
MRAMAAQRLQAEVHSLQNSLAQQQAHAPTVVSPFVLVDTLSYALQLPLVDQLLRSSRVVIIVPLAVIAGLDDLKKGNGKVNRGAREATKFLETHFKRGNPNLRAQRRGEHADPPFDLSPETP